MAEPLLRTERWASSLRVIGALLLLICLVAAHHWQALGSTLFDRALQNALHMPAFAVLGFFVGRSQRAFSTRTCLLICIGLALILEGSQLVTARDASARDLFADSAGAVCGLLVARGTNLLRVLGASLLIIATAWPPVSVWLAYRERDAIFPHLIRADTYRSELFSSNSRVTGGVQADARPAGMQVCWSDVPYPGIQLDEVVPAWFDYETLRVEFEVDGVSPMDLTVAVGYQGLPGTSAYVPRQFSPGQHTWDIPVEKLNAGGNAISHLIIHSRPHFAGRCISLQSVLLR